MEDRYAKRSQSFTRGHEQPAQAAHTVHAANAANTGHPTPTEPQWVRVWRLPNTPRQLPQATQAAGSAAGPAQGIVQNGTPSLPQQPGPPLDELWGNGNGAPLPPVPNPSSPPILTPPVSSPPVSSHHPRSPYAPILSPPIPSLPVSSLPVPVSSPPVSESPAFEHAQVMRLLRRGQQQEALALLDELAQQYPTNGHVCHTMVRRLSLKLPFLNIRMSSQGPRAN